MEQTTTSFSIATTAIGGEVALSREERERHVYLVGKSGSGKSTALFNLAMHDLYAGEGVAVIDPHGDLAEAIIDAMPPSRTNEVCHLNVADTDFPVGFNPIAGIAPERHALAASPHSSTYGRIVGDLASSIFSTTASQRCSQVIGLASSTCHDCIRTTSSVTGW